MISNQFYCIKCDFAHYDNGTKQCNKEACLSAVGDFFFDSETIIFTKQVSLP